MKIKLKIELKRKINGKNRRKTENKVKLKRQNVMAYQRTCQNNSDPAKNSWKSLENDITHIGSY